MVTKLAYLAAFIELCSTIPYLFDMVRRKTKPNIVSWSVWTVLGVIETTALFAEHVNGAGVLALGGTIAISAVVILGIHYGFAKFNALDIFCLLGAGVAVLGWYLAHSAKLGLYISAMVDLIVSMPTVYHAWHRYREETLICYELGVTSGIMVLFTLKNFNTVSLIYPLLLITIDGAISIAIIRGRLRYVKSRHKAAIKAARTRRRNKLKGRVPALLIR